MHLRVPFILAAGLIAAGLLASPLAAQQTERVSVDSNGVEASKACSDASLSADGRYVAFVSGADNLVPGDVNRRQDIFVHDRLTGQTSLVSVTSWGVQADAGSHGPSISADGRFVAFTSDARNLVPGDTNNYPDIFVHDRQTGQTSRVSVDSAGRQSNSLSHFPSISDDGMIVAFESYAGDLVAGDTNGRRDAFVHDRQTGQTSRVSVDSAGGQSLGQTDRPVVSGDGRFVAFTSDGTDLVPGDTNASNDVFVHDRTTGTTRRVSVDSQGVQGNSYSSDPSLSGDGRFVGFSSGATNLVPGDTNNDTDVFIHDLLTGSTARASVDSAGMEGNHGGNFAALSANGRIVSFKSFSDDLTPGDVNGLTDIFVHDRQTGQTSLVSVDSAGQQQNGSFYGLAQGGISADGRIVAFASDADNLVAGDTNGVFDVFVHERGGVGPTLTQSGTCPGAMTMTISGASAHGRIAIACGTAGTFVKAAQPCLGIVLSVRPPIVGSAMLTADASGSAVLQLQIPPAACGLSVQALDLATCAPTNVIVL